jgi:hypothetical protein
MPADFYTGACQTNAILYNGTEQDIGYYGIGYSDQESAPDCSISEPDKQRFFFGIKFSDGASNTIYAQNTINPGKWYSVVATYDGVSMTIYVNGVRENVLTVYKFLGNHNDDITIGSQFSGSYPYWVNGNIDDIRIYKRALTEAEIQQLYEYEKVAVVSATRDHAERYVAGESFESCITMAYKGNLTDLDAEESVPAGWSFASVSGDNPPDDYPAVGTTGLLGFGWDTIPEFPFEFCYTTQVPATETGHREISGSVHYRKEDGSNHTEPIQPDPDPVSDCDYHSGDYKPADWSISLSELLRCIKFYNIGEYACDASSEDGYSSGPGDHSCTPHSSDYNPQDWTIDFSELLRPIQLYNGGFYVCDKTGEDGYALEDAAILAQSTRSTEPVSANHFADDYVPGSNLIITAQIEYEGNLNAVGVVVDLPPNWRFVSASGTDRPAIVPSYRQTGTLNFGWLTPPVSPFEFTYTVRVPADADATQQLNAKVHYRRLTGELIEPVQPYPLEFKSCSGDLDEDKDVDGEDLFRLNNNGEDVALDEFAEEFGQINCN